MTKAEKQKHILKLMVIALNKVIESGVIDLNGKSVECPADEKHEYQKMVIAGRPAVINWFDAGHDELRISLWWDYQPEMMPTYRKKWLEGFTTCAPTVNRKYFRYILGACGTCYLERRSGKFIIGDAGNQFTSVYVREDSAFEMNNIKPEQPDGYSIHGRIAE